MGFTRVTHTNTERFFPFVQRTLCFRPVWISFLFEFFCVCFCFSFALMNTIPTTARYKCRNWSLNKPQAKLPLSKYGGCTYLQYKFWNVLPFRNVETLYRRFRVRNAYTFSENKGKDLSYRAWVSYICLQGSLSSRPPHSVKWSVVPKRFSNAKQTGTTTRKQNWAALWELS